MRLVRTLRLRDDPSLIAQYIEVHKSVWPEIQKGIRSVGITGMEIYISGATLFMIIDMADGADPESAFARLATLPRQAEWEEYVSRFQQADKGATSGEKWRDAQRVFTLK